MTDPAKRERAALDVLALLPEWWAVGPTSYDPGTGRWSYTARGPHPGRGKHPETITGTGEDELAAMIDLASGSTSGDATRSSPRSTGVGVRRSSKVPRSGPGRSRVGR